MIIRHAEIISDDVPLYLCRDKLSRFATKGAPLPGNMRPVSAASKGLSREERRRILVNGRMVACFEIVVQCRC